MWNDRIISDKEVQINLRAVVTKYFVLVYWGTIQTKSVIKGKLQKTIRHKKFTYLWKSSV